ncbi:MAG: hypothetical protein FWG40_12435 [Peptococcaceae bacterium]|jgi:hypothetical protein|nr:hypothetical protein [Peptococcaceae bacterium]
MSTIRINTGSVKDCAHSITTELPDWYSHLTSCHQELANLIENGDWQGTTAEILVAEYYNMILARYVMPNLSTSHGYADFLQNAVINYVDTEDANTSKA